jgi:hypothetical protein
MCTSSVSSSGILKKGARIWSQWCWDINKAFDTIPDSAMVPALRKKGLPAQLFNMINDAYLDVHTTITADGGETTTRLRRGVKQGDPMSPLLFTAVLEHLLLALEAHPGYTIDEGSAVSSMAFPEDLVLLAESPEQAGRQLLAVEAYLGGLGMSLSATKCEAFKYAQPKNLG